MGTEAQAVQPSAAENLAAGLKERRAATATADAAAGSGGGAGGGDAGAEVKMEAETAAPVVDVAKPEAGKEAPKDAATDEVQQLKDRLAAIEGRETTLTANRKAQDALEDFIKSKVCEDLPREMLRKFMPVTADAKQLKEAAGQLRQWVNAIIDNQVKGGHLTRRSITTAAPGGGVSADQLTQNGGAYDNIALGLRQTSRAQVVDMRGDPKN